MGFMTLEREDGNPSLQFLILKVWLGQYMKLYLLSTSVRKDIVGCIFAQRASSGYHEESSVLFYHLQRTESRPMKCITVRSKIC